MQRILLFFLLGFCVSVSSTAVAQTITLPQAASPAAEVTQRIGITDINIQYARPSVRGRQIWGGLVHYGMVNLGFGTAEKSPWRAGANENTVFSVSNDVQIEGQDLPAGTYGFFIIVNEEGTATLIFSSNHTSWGSYFYAPEEDVLRVDITTEEVAHTETLMYSFPEVGADYAVAALDWEKKRFPFKVSVDVAEVVVQNGKNELRSTTGFGWQGPYSLAQFAVQNNVHMTQAIQWAQQAAAQQPNFSTKSLVAQIQTTQGMEAEGEATMKEALAMGNPLEIHQYARQLIAQGQAEKAMEVFRYNAEKHPDTWPVHYGLARGHSALGNFEDALKEMEMALENAPNTPSRNAVQANIEKLSLGEDIN